MSGKEKIRAGDRPKPATVRKRPLSDAQCNRFLQALAEMCNVRAAAEAAALLTGVVYQRRRTDPVFAAAWQDSVATGYERLEAALLRRSLDCFDEAEADGEEADGDEADPTEGAIVKATLPAGKVAQRLWPGEVQVALALLARHPPSAAQKAKCDRTTAAATDAALTRKLDALARKLGDPV